MKYISLFCIIGIIGCAQGNCRSQRLQSQKEVSPMVDKLDEKNRIKIYKYDGSLQCGQGQSVPVQEMQKELQGIHVYSAVNKQDGLMHIQLCGSPTGKANVYEIDAKDLEQAKTLGFKQWIFN